MDPKAMETPQIQNPQIFYDFASSIAVNMLKLEQFGL